MSRSTEDAMVRKPSSVLVETMVIGDVMVIEEQDGIRMVVCLFV